MSDTPEQQYEYSLQTTNSFGHEDIHEGIIATNDDEAKQKLKEQLDSNTEIVSCEVITKWKVK